MSKFIFGGVYQTGTSEREGEREVTSHRSVTLISLSRKELYFILIKKIIPNILLSLPGRLLDIGDWENVGGCAGTRLSAE